MSNFVHLHIDSEFSLLDGANRIKDIPVIAKELGISNKGQVVNVYKANQIIPQIAYVESDDTDITDENMKDYNVFSPHNKINQQGGYASLSETY